jgi:leader peptidase (prepilin peptidase)/N-methyltransferase
MRENFYCLIRRRGAPFEAIPWCFGLATSGALLAVMFACLGGEPVVRTTKIPFAAFLCPALWIVFYADSVMR